MKLLDVNLLIYAANRAAPLHEPARAWVDNLLSSSETVALPWPVLMAFVRLTTNPRVMDRPLDGRSALGYVRGWLERSTVVTPEPTNRHVAVLEDLLARTGTGGNLVSDAHLATLAIEHGATLCSCDNDFSRFPSLSWVNPLVPAR